MSIGPHYHMQFLGVVTKFQPGNIIFRPTHHLTPPPLPSRMKSLSNRGTHLVCPSLIRTELRLYCNRCVPQRGVERVHFTCPLSMFSFAPFDSIFLHRPSWTRLSDSTSRSSFNFPRCDWRTQCRNRDSCHHERGNGSSGLYKWHIV